MNDTTGLETARAKAEELKASAKADNAARAKASTLSTTVSPEVLAMLQENAGLGAQDMGMNASSPVLRVHSSSSTKNVLSNGEQPTVGNFFYTATKQEFENPVVRILYVKKCGLPKMKERPTDEPELKANYVVAGLLYETNEPFVMYINGMSYNKMWVLQDTLKLWVKGMRIPMFALQIRLSTKLEQDQAKKYAAKPVVHYELLMNETGDFPLIEQDKNTIQMLVNATKQAEEIVNELVAAMLEKEGFAVPTQAIKSNQYSNGRVEVGGGASGGDGGGVNGGAGGAFLPEEVTEVEDMSDDIPF